MASETSPPRSEAIAQVVRRLWNAETGAWGERDLAGLTDLTNLTGPDGLPAARPRPVTPEERPWFPTEHHAALHVPLHTLTDPDTDAGTHLGTGARTGPREGAAATADEAGAKADAFRRAAEVVTGVLGPAALLGCWGDRGPFDTPPPSWGGPFRRWHRPDRPNSLELCAGEDGPELVLQPKDPAEHWLERLGEAPRPINALVAFSPDDPANAGLGLPGFQQTEEWGEFTDALRRFLATLPTVTRALGIELSIPLHAATPGTFGPVTFHLACGDALELALHQHRSPLPDDYLARLGWIAESTMPSSQDHRYEVGGGVSHHSAAYGPGETAGAAVADLLAETARAFGIRAPTGLNTHDSADDLGGYHLRCYALPHGGYRFADEDAPAPEDHGDREGHGDRETREGRADEGAAPPAPAPRLTPDESLDAAERAHEEGADETAVRALTQAARAGAAQRALEAAHRYALVRESAGERAGALRYAEATLALPAETGPAELRHADRLRAAGAVDRARHAYEQLADSPSFAVELLARGRLLALARELGDEPAQRALLTSRLAEIQWHTDRPTALRTFRAAAETGVPLALYDLATRLLLQDETEEARTVLQRVSELDTGLVCRALLDIGRTHAMRGEPDTARAWYLRALDAPGEPDTAALAGTHARLGGTAKAARDLPEARRRYQAVLDLRDPIQRPLAAAHLAEIAYWEGDHDAAARHYEFTLATGTRDAELVGEAGYRLGEIRQEAGERDLAKRSLRRAVDSGHEGYAQRARALLDTLP